MKHVHLNLIRMPMREPFAASHGVETDKVAIIVSVETLAGAIGYAECVAGASPHYTEETAVTAWHLLEDWLVPTCLTRSFDTTEDIARWSKEQEGIRGNRMAKAGLEMALWDALSADSGVPLVDWLGGVKQEVPVGISIGIQPSLARLVDKVDAFVEQGFQRVKLKIEPGSDEGMVQALRKAYPSLPLMVDANSAYVDTPLSSLGWLDEYELMMVEQPLGYDDLVQHAALQQRLKTSVCLDESIRSTRDLVSAAHLQACRIVNVKAGRVGGFSEVQNMHKASKVHGMQLWCGGMLETGIGRLHNIALSSLDSFTLPGDTAPSARYFEEDLIDPPVTFSRSGWLPVEPLCGVSSRVRTDRIQKWTVRSASLR